MWNFCIVESLKQSAVASRFLWLWGFDHLLPAPHLMVKKNAKEIINKHEACHSNEQSGRWSDLTISRQQTNQRIIIQSRDDWDQKSTKTNAFSSASHGTQWRPEVPHDGKFMRLYIQSFGKNILVIPHNNENCLGGGEGWGSCAQVLTTNQISRFKTGFDSQLNFSIGFRVLHCRTIGSRGVSYSSVSAIMSINAELFRASDFKVLKLSLAFG